MKVYYRIKEKMTHSNRSTTSNFNTYINNIKDYRDRDTPRTQNDSKYK